MSARRRRRRRGAQPHDACFDVSPPLISRLIDGEPRRFLRAVDGVDLFRSRAARRFGIVGESGSGKSTLARMVVGLHAGERRGRL